MSNDLRQTNRKKQAGHVVSARLTGDTYDHLLALAAATGLARNRVLIALVEQATPNTIAPPTRTPTRRDKTATPSREEAVLSSTKGTSHS